MADLRRGLARSRAATAAALASMNVDGSAATRLTYGAALEDFPTWSPTGSRIAFESDRDGNREVYVMNANGAAQARLTSHPSFDGQPAWSPDGSRIAFTSFRDGNYELYSTNAAAGAPLRLTTTPASEQAPDWQRTRLPSTPIAPSQRSARDTTAPALGAVRISPARFRVGLAPTPILAARRRARVGTRLRYAVSEAAAVRIEITRRHTGRRVGRRCLTAQRRVRRGRRCARHLRAGTLVRFARAGPNAMGFSGRIGPRALKPGRYRTTLTATDAAGNRSARAGVTFEIVRR